MCLYAFMSSMFREKKRESRLKKGEFSINKNGYSSHRYFRVYPFIRGQRRRSFFVSNVHGVQSIRLAAIDQRERFQKCEVPGFYRIVYSTSS